MSTTREEIQGEINALRQLLTKNDYIASKIAMGRATREEYAEDISNSDKWANEVDKLEAQLAKMDNRGIG